MAVYVDDWLQPARVGRLYSRWSHLTADTEKELHAFAKQLGLKRSWFQHNGDPLFDHYDLTEGKRHQAIALGAVAETWREAGDRLARRIEERNAAQ